MIDTILKTIDNKARQEIDSIIKENKEAIFALESEHQKNLQDKREKEKKELRNRVQAEIEEFRQKEQQKADFRLQAERNKIVEAVYKAAKKIITELSTSDFKAVVKTLLNCLPEGIEGEISAGKRTAEVLQGMFSLNCLVKGDLDEEGIIFKSKDIEVDLRISQVLKQNREKTDPEIIQILFNS